MKLEKAFSHFSYNDFSDILLQKMFLITFEVFFKCKIVCKQNLFPQFLLHCTDRNTEQLDEPVSMRNDL